MDECYDGVKDLPKPPPTIPPKRTAAPVIAREVKVPETYHCSDTDKGMGQFQKDSGIFQSYNFPKQYPAEEFCYYCVSPAEEGGYVKVSVIYVWTYETWWDGFQVEIDELALDRKKNCHKNGDYIVVEQENKQAYYLCNVKKRDGHTIVNRGNICLKFVTNKNKNKKGFKAKYSQGNELHQYSTLHHFQKLPHHLVDVVVIKSSSWMRTPKTASSSWNRANGRKSTTIKWPINAHG